MKLKFIKHIAKASLLLMSAVSLPAQGVLYSSAEVYLPDDEIVISARGYKKPLTSSNGSIGILTSEGIMKLNPVSVSDSTGSLTGVFRSSDSPWGSEISIRGAARDKVIMLIDGSRMNTATDIGAQFGTLNPASVERIEVLKGPISSLYGSGSIGGVVNIFTRTGGFFEDPGFRSGVSISGESNSKGKDLYGYTSYNSNSWYLFGSGGYRSHDSYRDGDGKTVAQSGFDDADCSVNFGFKPFQGHTVEFRTQFYEGWDIGIPGARDSVPATASKSEYKRVRRGLVSADYNVVPGNYFWAESKLHVYWQYVGREVEIENGTVRVEPEAEHNTLGMQWSNIFALERNIVVAGADLWIRTISTSRKKTSITTGTLIAEDTPVPDASYLSAGVFAEDEYRYGSLTLNGGARGDFIRVANEKTYRTDFPATSEVIWEEGSLHQGSWNGHMGASYKFMKYLSSGIIGASAYRAASLEERYKYIALGTVEHRGNPGLDPERSFFVEHNVHFKSDIFRFNCAIFFNEFQDLIADVRQSPTEYRLENISGARIYGAEYDIEVPVTEWFTLHNDLTYISGKDTDSDDYLPSLPPLRVVSGVRFRSSTGLSAFFDSVYTAAQKRVPDGAPESESWVRLDAGVSWRFAAGGGEHRFNVTCVNLLDKCYYDYLTMSKTGYVFNEPGRNFKFGYNGTF